MTHLMKILSHSPFGYFTIFTFVVKEGATRAPKIVIEWPSDNPGPAFDLVASVAQEGGSDSFAGGGGDASPNN